MASSSAHTMKALKGLESRKSNSWWWDTHIGSRNAKWLAENVDDMDQHHKRMLTLIEGDGDSLAKKADMYYQRRPELIAHVEEFYRTYKALAERYEHVTGDMRKHLSELQSQASDLASETSTNVGWTPPHDPKIGRRGFGHRAAGFDFFLGYGKTTGPDRSASRDETSSISDSETESDVSSLYSYPGMAVHAAEEGPHIRTGEPDVESCVDEKFQNHGQEYNKIRRSSSENFDDVHSRIASYEEELKMAKEKIFESEEEIASLKTELQKCKSLEHPANLFVEFPGMQTSSSFEKVEPEFDADNVLALYENSDTVDADDSGSEEKVQVLVKALRSTRDRLQAVDKELIKLRKENGESTESIRRMQDLHKIAQKDAATWKRMLETEKRLAAKLQERIARYKTSLNDREKEVRELKEVVSDANRKYQLHDEISRLSDEKSNLEERLHEWEMRCHSLESQRGMLETKLNDEIEHLKADIAEKTSQLEGLETDFDAYRLKYDSLLTEKEEVESEVRAKEAEIIEMQHKIAENEVCSKRAEEEALRVEELREEVERQKDLIMEAAEGKREAIRQLCYSLEHYRSNYQQLRQAFTGHKQHRLDVCAS